MNRGFTLTELLVTIGLMIFLAGLIVPSWRAGEVNSALNRSAHKLSQDIRRAQELSLRAQAYICPNDPAETISAYGIFFDEVNPSFYILFAECNGNNTYNEGTDGIVEIISLESGIEIQSVFPGSAASIVFIPPIPIIFINPGDLDSGQIVLARVNDATAVKTITITNKGIIDVD